MPAAKKHEQCNIWNLPHLKWLAGNHGWNITQLSFHDHLPLSCGWSQGFPSRCLCNWGWVGGTKCPLLIFEDPSPRNPNVEGFFITSGSQTWQSKIPHGYGSIPINTIFSGMNIHLPAILMFTRGTGFWPIPTFQFRDLPEKNMISRGFPSLGALAKLLVSMMCFAPRRSWWWKIADADR